MGVMDSDTLSIGELADAAGLSRRAVRFYVQQKLIDPPEGLGRGNHYGKSHLSQLQRIAELQSMGHSLDEIRQILAGAAVQPPDAPRRRPRARVEAELWSRMKIGPGIELSFDATAYSPSAQELLELRDVIRKRFGVDIESET